MEVSFAVLVTDEFILKSVIIFRSLFLPQNLLLTGLITLVKQHAGPVISYCRFVGRQPTARFKKITAGKFNITSSVTSRRNSAVQIWIEVTCGLSASVDFLRTGKDSSKRSLQHCRCLHNRLWQHGQVVKRIVYLG